VPGDIKEEENEIEVGGLQKFLRSPASLCCSRFNGLNSREKRRWHYA
jgi:hypothetical protein